MISSRLPRSHELPRKTGSLVETATGAQLRRQFRQGQIHG